MINQIYTAGGLTNQTALYIALMNYRIPGSYLVKDIMKMKKREVVTKGSFLFCIFNKNNTHIIIIELFKIQLIFYYLHTAKPYFITKRIILTFKNQQFISTK